MIFYTLRFVTVMCEICSETTHPAFRLQRGLDVSNKLRQLLPDCYLPLGGQGGVPERRTSQLIGSVKSKFWEILDFPFQVCGSQKGPAPTMATDSLKLSCYMAG